MLAKQVYCMGTSGYADHSQLHESVMTVDLTICRRCSLAKRRKAIEKHIENMEKVLRALTSEQLQPRDVASTQETIQYLLSDVEDEELLGNMGAHCSPRAAALLCWRWSHFNDLT